MLTKLDNYLNYTDVLEESRIVVLLELAYEDGITVEVLTNLIEDLADTLEANSIYDEAHDFCWWYKYLLFKQRKSRSIERN